MSALAAVSHSTRCLLLDHGTRSLKSQPVVNQRVAPTPPLNPHPQPQPQVNFPRTQRIRKRWLMRRVAELLIFLGLFLFIIQQYVTPTVEVRRGGGGGADGLELVDMGGGGCILLAVSCLSHIHPSYLPKPRISPKATTTTTITIPRHQQNSQMALRQSDWPRVIERVLKLAIPTIYTWLCMFYWCDALVLLGGCSGVVPACSVAAICCLLCATQSPLTTLARLTPAPALAFNHLPSTTIHPFHLSIHPSIHPSSTHPSIHPSIIHLSIHPPTPSLFHLHLNVMGELTRFGDREFYKDFWNASTVGEYWCARRSHWRGGWKRGCVPGMLRCGRVSSALVLPGAALRCWCSWNWPKLVGAHSAPLALRTHCSRV